MRWMMLLLILISAQVDALEGLENLELRVFQKNLGYQSEVDLTEGARSQKKAFNSGFFPTVNAIGGWQRNKTDELSSVETGYVGYLEGRANIFSGFKDYALAQAGNIDLQLAEIDLQLKKNELRLQLTEVISDMIYLHQFQDLLQEELAVTQSQRKMAGKKVSAGLTGPVDNLELDLRENEIEIELLNQKQMHAENHQKIIKLLGEDIADEELDKIRFSSVSSFQKSIQQFNSEKSIEFQRALLVKRKHELEQQQVQSEFYPQLDLTYAVGRLTPSDDSSLAFNENKFGVQLTIPLFSGFETYHRNKSLIFKTAAAEKNKNQVQLYVMTQYQVLKNRINDSISLIAISDRKLKNSQKYFDLTLAEYRRGIKNSPDLVGATDRLFSTKKRKLELHKELELLSLRLQQIY